MKDNDGDRIRVEVIMGEVVDINFYLDGEPYFSELTPKKARKLARKLNKAAYQVDGKTCDRGQQVTELQAQLADAAIELANAKREIDHLQREAAAKADGHQIGDVRKSAHTGDQYLFVGGDKPWQHIASGRRYNWPLVLKYGRLVERNGEQVAA